MSLLFSFGKKRRSKRSSTKKSGKGRKPPASLIRRCKKYGIKVTVKRGSKRVYKKISLLKKLCKKKMRKMRKVRKSRKVRKVRKSRKVLRLKY
jgi:hypothetical protein